MASASSLSASLCCSTGREVLGLCRDSSVSAHGLAGAGAWVAVEQRRLLGKWLRVPQIPEQSIVDEMSPAPVELEEGESGARPVSGASSRAVAGGLCRDRRKTPDQDDATTPLTGRNFTCL